MEKQYKLGIVFSGGGTKAAAHCGVLQAFKEYGIKPDIMAGTSAGSLVAAYYSAGFDPVEMIKLFSGMNFFRDIVAPAAPKGGFFNSRPLVKYIKEVMPYENVEDLPIPVKIVATDMDNGKSKVFTEGELAPRLVASCSIPVIFKPMLIDGIHYIDGGVLMNLPIPTIRQECEKIISIAVREVTPQAYKDNVMHVASRAYELMFMSNLRIDAHQADTHIEIDTANFSALDISNIEKLFHLGYTVACKQLDKDGYQRIMPPEEVTFPKHDKKAPFERYRNQLKDNLYKLELRRDELKYAVKRIKK